MTTGEPRTTADEAKSGENEPNGEVRKRMEKEIGDLVAFYKDLHTNPELSLKEVRTSAKLAAELKNLGFDVTTKFGATGVVGVLKNGKGPTVLIRTDMDALPVTEATGLPYASKVRVRDKNDNEVGVMHACGHDIHMTSWVGAARVLSGMKDRWKGTLVFIAQPAEEIGTGARLMLEAGLYEKFPKPDYCLALHADAQRAHGTIGYTEGMAMANVDSVDIIVKGKGGHGATPHMTVDPIVLSARIIMDLQTLVSRETNPVDSAVVTVGSIHGGTKHNIIPNEVKLQLTVRSFKESVRKHLLDGIKRIAEGCAKAANAPPPVVTVDLAEFTPALSNDAELTRKTVAVFKNVLGEKNVLPRPPLMGGEDFARYAVGKTPVFMWWLGTIDPAKVLKAENGGSPLPSMHSALYYPEPEPSLRLGVTTLSLGALNLLK
ncbi:MAG: amidohydrolase [Planctomycetia bacterium]|nr:amidohydrolase [Planctomycetia bacterium]